jgi:hypothetical protein
MNDYANIKVMKILQNIFTNPFAIAAALVHWLIFVYCLIFEDTGIFSKSISFHQSNEVYQWLIYLNCLPLTIVETIGTILEKTIGMNLILNITLIGFALFIVNFQWLFVGYCFSKLFNLFESEEKGISLD